MSYVSKLTDIFWKKSGLNKEKYKIFIETGTYRGDTIEYLKHDYDKLISIEITKKWYNYCVDKFKNDKHITLYHGDAIDILPNILKNINEPAIIFLDSHYSGGTTGKTNKNTTDTALLEELKILQFRNYDDIIIIDDTSFLGSKGGDDKNTNIYDDSIMWHPFKWDWEGITHNKIQQYFKYNYNILTNSENYTITPRNDQYILYPPKCIPPINA